MNMQQVFDCGSPLPLLTSDRPSARLQRAKALTHLKAWRLRLGSLALLTLILCLRATAQSYSVDWYKIAGGGGTSTNGQYVVNGTIGQQDAGGPLTGGNYSITGGFWSLIAVVQTPGAPHLRIVLTSTNNAVIAWPAPSTGFTLQQNSNLNTTNWIAVSNPVNVVGNEKQVGISPPVGKQFYRLTQQ